MAGFGAGSLLKAKRGLGWFSASEGVIAALGVFSTKSKSQRVYSCLRYHYSKVNNSILIQLELKKVAQPRAVLFRLLLVKKTPRAARGRSLLLAEYLPRQKKLLWTGWEKWALAIG